MAGREGTVILREGVSFSLSEEMSVYRLEVSCGYRANESRSAWDGDFDSVRSCLNSGAH